MVTRGLKWASFVALTMFTLGNTAAAWGQAGGDISKGSAGETSAASTAPVHYYSAQQVDAGFESAAGIGMIYNGDGGTRNFLIMAATRSTPGGGELHTKFTDVIYVVKGSATLVTGGQLSGVDENTINPSTGKPFPKDEIRSKSVAGGEPHHLAVGDMIVVPNGVPHQFSEVEGQFRYQLIKIRQP